MTSIKTPLVHLAKDALQSICFPGRFQWRLPAASRAVALTFDDGPHPEHTPAVLDMLDRAGVRATFFMIGREVEAHPAVARRVVEAGHVVAGHSHEHVVITAQSPTALAADLKRCRAAIADATGVDTLLFRPPKGEVSLPSIARVCRLGYRLVHWSKTFSDYRQDGTAPLLERIGRIGVSPRDILLFHDNNRFTVEALESAISAWQVAGVGFETL